MRVVAWTGLVADEDRWLTGAGLRDPDVRLCAVSSLPRNGETGKLRRFVPLDARQIGAGGGGGGFQESDQTLSSIGVLLT